MWFQLWLTQLKKFILHWTKNKIFFLRLLCKTQSAISPLWRHFRKSHRGSCCFFQAAAPSSPSVNPTRVRTEGPAGWAGKLSSVTAPLGTEGRTAAVVRGLSFVYIDPVVLLVSQHLMIKNEKFRDNWHWCEFLSLFCIKKPNDSQLRWPLIGSSNCTNGSLSYESFAEANCLR